MVPDVGYIHIVKDLIERENAVILLAKRLLAMVNIFVESPLLDNVVAELEKLPSVEELYEVTGEFDIVSRMEEENGETRQ